MIRDLLVPFGHHHRSAGACGNGNRASIWCRGASREFMTWTVTETVSGPKDRTWGSCKAFTFSVADVAKWQTQGT